MAYTFSMVRLMSKVHPRVLFTIGILLLTIFFGSIILTNLNIANYETSRVIIYSSLLGIILTTWISIILYKKGLVKEIPPSEDKKYLLIGLVISGTLLVLTSLSMFL